MASKHRDPKPESVTCPWCKGQTAPHGCPLCGYTGTVILPLAIEYALKEPMPRVDAYFLALSYGPVWGKIRKANG